LFKKELRLDKLKQNWEKPAIAAILLLAAFLTCFEIWNEGYGNEFYTAAVKSMTMSWHNFFFASLDPGGFITVDKPAPGLWLQCLFALVFGVNGWSVILPEALCSVASVWVLFRMVKRSFGAAAGVLSALFLSLTPIFIAASRSNNLDAALVLVCLLSVWALLRAAEEGSLKFLILSMALLGVGFNIKTLEAYLYLPAICLVYFFAANTTWKKRILHLLIATVVLLVVSLSWALTVDLIPAGERPYVGSSTTNSELALALGYNGLDRVLPNSVLRALGQEAASGLSSDSAVNSVISSGNGVPDEGGAAGVLRMFNSEMAGQASWMLVFALFGMLALLMDILTRPKGKRKPITRQLLCWAGLFVPMYALFSMSSHFHRYYLIMYAPCLAALTAIGFTEMWKFYTGEGLKGIGGVLRGMLPAAIAATAAVQLCIISYYGNYSSVFIPVICIGAGISCAGLVACARIKKVKKNIAKLAAAAGLLALLAAPAYWSLTPIIFGSNASIPVAGPSGMASMLGGGTMHQGVRDASRRQDSHSGDNGERNAQDGLWFGFSEGQGGTRGAPDGVVGEEKAERGRTDSGFADMSPGIIGGFPGNIGGLGGDMGRTISDAAIKYMMSNYSGERYLVAVPSAGYAESIIIKYGVGVMALGGFKGDDNAISLEDFKALVLNGELRYYWAGGERGNSEITKWVEENGRQVSNSVINASSDTGTESSAKNSASMRYLYDLSGLKTAG